MKRLIANDHFTNSCYFRTSVEKPYRKALIQITEKCNLGCAHCFVFARKHGNQISLEDIQNKILPQLQDANVISITLTGGEPMSHPDIEKITNVFVSNNMKVTICTNGTMISEEQMNTFKEIGDVYCNVSLDGFSKNSHGRFRGSPDSFKTTVNTIRKLSTYNLLKGILVTPNNLAKIYEYEEICQFAIKYGAKYVLMNPLSNMGRGILSKHKLEMQTAMMKNIKKQTLKYKDRINVVHIRFPNDEKLLTTCEAGNIIYVFTKGEVTVCPYLVFASNNQNNKHSKEEFIIGNILNDTDVAIKLNNYNYLSLHGGDNETCISCSKIDLCGKGCPAGVIASSGGIGDLDTDVCPLI